MVPVARRLNGDVVRIELVSAGRVFASFVNVDIYTLERVAKRRPAEFQADHKRETNHP